jgi:hypothetical protein
MPYMLVSSCGNRGQTTIFYFSTTKYRTSGIGHKAEDHDATFTATKQSVGFR